VNNNDPSSRARPPVNNVPLSLFVDGEIAALIETHRKRLEARNDIRCSRSDAIRSLIRKGSKCP
jgi:hypothetical protein